jgi:hypothetical protein
MSIAEYRKIVKDTESTDERIQERIDYIASLCRNIIRIELEKARYTNPFFSSHSSNESNFPFQGFHLFIVSLKGNS